MFDPSILSRADFPNTNEEVGWRDPTELPQTPRTPRRVAPVTSQNAMKFVGTPRFALSGDNDELIIAKIHSLKGIVCTDIEKIERNYTHFIAETPNRGQNTFACVVAGKWLLSPQYVIDSADAGYFMDVSIALPRCRKIEFELQLFAIYFPSTSHRRSYMNGEIRRRDLTKQTMIWRMRPIAGASNCKRTQHSFQRMVHSRISV